MCFDRLEPQNCLNSSLALIASRRFFEANFFPLRVAVQSNQCVPVFVFVVVVVDVAVLCNHSVDETKLSQNETGNVFGKINGNAEIRRKHVEIGHRFERRRLAP